MIGGIRTCLGVSDDPMFLWISSSSCPLNLLLVRSHQAEIIIVKRLTQGCNNLTRVRVEPRSFDQGHRKNELHNCSQWFSSQGSAQGCSQEFGLGAALKRYVQSHARCVSADANFSERIHP